MARPTLERLTFIGLVGVAGIAFVAALQLVLAAWLPMSGQIGAVAIIALAAALYMFVMRRMVSRVDERRQRFAAIFAEHPDAIAVYNVDGTMVHGNPAAATLVGGSSDLIGKPWTEHVVPRERRHVVEEFQTACTGKVVKFETLFLSAIGEEIPVACYLVPTIVNGSVVSIIGTARDLREIKRITAQEQLQVARIAALANIKSDFASRPREQIQRLLEFTTQTLRMEEGAVSNVSGNMLRVMYSASPLVRVGLEIDFDRTFARHMYGSREMLAIDDATIGDWPNDDAVKSQGWQSYIGATIFVEGQAFGILSFTRRTPRREPFSSSDRDFMRIATSLIGSSLERVRRETQLAQAANTDGVTGLPNRAAFEEHMRKLTSMVKRQGGHVRLHLIDLDGFKNVNDSYGHHAGDEVLRVIAARFRSLVREEDMVARLGGDEFVVAEWTRRDESGSTALGDRIVAAASELIYVGDHIVRIGASVGVAAYPRHAQSEEDLLKCADSAMYSAKSAGKGAVKLYSYG